MINEEGLQMALESMRKAYARDEVREMIEDRLKAARDEQSRRVTAERKEAAEAAAAAAEAAAAEAAAAAAEAARALKEAREETEAAREATEAAEKAAQGALEQGLEKGLEKGLVRGARESALLIARRLLEQGMEREQVLQVTGLTDSELEGLNG
jgi:predicted transposase YdaD